MSETNAKPFSYEYARPALTVDVAVVTRALPHRVLLIRRRHDPFAGRWALPGGFVDEAETLATAASRELKEETGLEPDDLEQLHTFGDPGRDPRGWTVSVVFLARIDADKATPVAADDASSVRWFSLARPPAMAFDHDRILRRVRTRLEDRGF